jgi:betaine-aldehyde dehydrogenase
MTGSRLLVQGAVADPFRKLLTKRLQAVKTGPASDPSSDMGPLIDKANVSRVDKMVEEAITAGAKVLVRGEPINEGPLAAGAFYRPTLLEVTDPKMTIVREKIFGPVLPMQVFDSEAEACGTCKMTANMAWLRAFRPGTWIVRYALPESERWSQRMPFRQLQ